MSRLLRRAVTTAVTAALTVGVAWASVGVAPVGSTARDAADAVAERTSAADAARGATDPVSADDTGSAVVAAGGPLGQGQVLAGAARTSIEPQPGPDDVWDTDYDRCATFSLDPSEWGDKLPRGVDHLAATGSPWPENPNCIYMGGFGIGPENPVTAWDQEFGLWVRAMSISDGTDTLVLAVVDAEGYFWDYNNKCDDCGIKQIAQHVGEATGIDPAGVVIAATHSHSAPDLIGGWGFVPDWYMEQVSTTIEQTIVEAVEGARPAVLEVGEERARQWNSERRDTYRSAEEQQLGWMRALAVGPGGEIVRGPGGDAEVIATLGAYAAHPTRWGTNDGTASPDWPGRFVHALEDRFGGVGLQIMTGLGNMSGSGPKEQMGDGLASLLPAPGEGHILENTDIRFEQRIWNQPTTNVPLTALGVPGFFDHRFNPTPAQVRTGQEPDTAPCVSGSPYSVEVPATAAFVGDELAITAGPGELFANLTNTIKEKSGALVTLPLAQANDSLGYIPQSFEHDRVGQQGFGFFAGGYVFVNYEDSYAIDHCFGDMVLETTLEMLAALR